MTVLIVATTLALAQAGAGEAPDAGSAETLRGRWNAYYAAAAGEYEMRAGKEGEITLKLREEPVLTYANPAGGTSSHGAIFVWTHEGRPEIFGAVWSRHVGNQRVVTHSLHSLSLEPLKATRQGKVFWSPDSPGVEPTPLAGAPEPAGTSQGRLVQMRQLARGVTGSTVRDGVERQLRLLPQPVYRTEESGAGRDGALFVFFEDWDPELFVLIEQRPSGSGTAWHASFARFTNLPVSAKHADREIWSFRESPAESAYGGLKHRYISVHGIESLPPNLGE